MTCKIIVAGGGIGGLVAALSLRADGNDVTVLERAKLDEREDELRSKGSGLTIYPNGSKVLMRFGVVDHLPERTVEFHRFTFRTKRGRVIYEESSDVLAERYGAPVLPLARADLFLALVATYGAESIVFDQQVEHYQAHDGGVTVTTQDGTGYEADVLIGADGVNSAVRAQLLDDGPAPYAGISAWRGIAPAAVDGMLVGEGANSWGTGMEFGWMPIIDGRVYWYASRLVPFGEHEGGDPAVEKRDARAAFADWHAPIPALIESTPTDMLLRLGLYYRPPGTSWGKGPVTLLGDAAHAMQPHLAQGANQAIEDGVVLAEELARHDEPVDGLRHYERRRIPRANRIVVQASRAGRSIHARNAVAASVRNRVAGIAMGRRGLKRWDRLLLGDTIRQPADSPGGVDRQGS